MKFSVATVTLSSISPLRFSKRHDAPSLEKESADKKDLRTVMEKAHWSADGSTLVIPATMMKAAIVGGASYANEKIKGKGQQTWAGKFRAGIAIMENIDTKIPRSDVGTVAIYCAADGKKGGAGGKSVLRNFPQVPAWSATFDIWILDPVIDEDKLRQMLELSGMFNGLGTWSPRVGGMNGRFVIDKLVWKDNRTFEPVSAPASAQPLDLAA